VNRPAVLLLSAGAACCLGLVLACLLLLPPIMYPKLTASELNQVKDPHARIELQQSQSQLQNNARSTLLQAVAGLVVVAGAVATWRQVQVNRQGHITEHFTRAVDQVGSATLDIRIGGIYALERVARNLREDRPQVQYILAAFIRGHAHRAPDAGRSGSPQPSERPPWLYVRAPDVQAALNVLSRRQPAAHALRLYLSRVDLRSANLDHARLLGAQVRHSDLSGSWMVAAALDGTDLCHSDLQKVRAIGATFVNCVLRGATFNGANLRDADFRGADLRGADMRADDLTGTRFTGILADRQTQWPDGFDPGTSSR
jgi:hypothetical protein